MTENEKDKETKKTAEDETFIYYEGEEIEEEGSGLETSDSEDDREPKFRPTEETEGEESSESEECEAADQLDVEAERNRILKEKWLRVTGKKPKSIPVVRKTFDPNIQRQIFFGDRKPMELEKEIRRKLLIRAHKIEHLGIKYGKIRAEIRSPKSIGGMLCLRFHPNSEILACCGRNGGVQVSLPHIRDTQTGEEILDIHSIEKTQQLPVWSARFLPSDSEKIYIAGEAGTIQAYHLETGELLGNSRLIDAIYTMDISQSGFYLATGGRDGKVHVVDPYTLQIVSQRYFINNGEPVPSTIYDEYHRLRVLALKFHPMDPNFFVTAGWDNNVKIWDVRTSGAVRYINGPEVHGEGVALRGNEILTASWRVENSLTLWDFSSGRLIENIPITNKFTKFEGEFLYTCLFFEENPMHRYINRNMVAAGGSGFQALIVINLSTHQIEEQFHSFKPISCLDISGNLIGYGGTESVFRIAQVLPKSQVKANAQ